MQQPKYEKTFYSSEPINGQRVKEDLFVGDDYIQAGQRIRSMDAGRCVPISLPIRTVYSWQIVSEDSNDIACGLANLQEPPSWNSEHAWCGQGGAVSLCAPDVRAACCHRMCELLKLSPCLLMM